MRAMSGCDAGAVEESSSYFYYYQSNGVFQIFKSAIPLPLAMGDSQGNHHYLGLSDLLSIGKEIVNFESTTPMVATTQCPSP